MSAKAVYRKMIYGLERIPAGVTTAKVWVGEWYDILRKRKMYHHIKWTKEQQEEFDTYWKTHYGKKISSRWHKLYQSINDTFNPAYFPEILYTTKLEPKGNDYYYAKVLQDKNLVELLADGVNVVTPKTILACCDGKLRTGDYRCVSEAEAENLLYSYEWIVMKPTSGGSSGKGVEVMNLQKDGVHLSEWIHQYKGNFIIQEAVHQHEALARLNPTSVNTLRIMTYRTEDGVHTAPHCLRMGRGGSRVDNVHAGGIVIHVREDGTLNRFAYELGYCDKKIRYEQHPDTHVHFENYKIPYVGEVVAEAKKMHLKLSHIQFVSWDFTINDQNQIVLIEVNLKAQGIWMPQVVSGQPFFGERIQK